MKRIFLLNTFLVFLCIVNGQNVNYDSIDRAKYNRTIDRYSQHYGYLLPDIAFQDDQNNTIRLTDFNQKLLIINIWATWCSPCISKIPHIRLAINRLKSHGIYDFLWINISIDEDTIAWKKMIKDMGISGVNLICNKDDMINHFKMIGTPTYLIVDENLQIMGFQLNGPQTLEMEYQIIRALDGVNCADSYKEIHNPNEIDYNEHFKFWMNDYMGDSLKY